MRPTSLIGPNWTGRLVKWRGEKTSHFVCSVVCLANRLGYCCCFKQTYWGQSRVVRGVCGSCLLLFTHQNKRYFFSPRFTFSSRQLTFCKSHTCSRPLISADQCCWFTYFDTRNNAKVSQKQLRNFQQQQSSQKKRNTKKFVGLCLLVVLVAAISCLRVILQVV